MKAGKNKKTIGILIFAILLIIISFASATISRVNVQYISPQLSSDYLASQGISLVPRFSTSECKAGQAFVVQVSPLGCDPSVVRSDLLEEQNVPVFCQLSATKINPLIDVKAIDSITFTPNGAGSSLVSGVGFHPAQAALSTGSSTLLNSPILNNIGYAVVVLNKQTNESALPDWVQGNLTAHIKYDINKAFGVGNAEFYLPEIRDDTTWQQNYKQYSFWTGRGYLRAESVGEDSALVSIYQDQNNKLATLTLQQGTPSREVYIPGFYCLAGLQLTLDGLETPDTMVRLNIDGDITQVVKREKFLDNRCYVVDDPIRRGLIQQTRITCNTDTGSDTFYLMISPNVEFNINNVKTTLEIGDELGTYTNNNKNYNLYLGYIDTDSKGNLAVGLIGKDTSQFNLNKLSDSELVSFSNIVKSDFDNLKQKGTFPKDKPGEIYYLSADSISKPIGDSKSTNFLNIALNGFGEASDTGSNIDFVNNFNSAVTDYKKIFTNFPDEKSAPNSNLDYDKFGVQSMISAIELAWKTNQKQTMIQLCDEMNNKYPNSMNNVIQECTNNADISNSQLSIHVVSINGVSKGISFEGIYEPTSDDYSAQISIDGKVQRLTKGQIFDLVTDTTGAETPTGEFIQLVSLTDDSAILNVAVKTSRRTSATTIPTQKSMTLKMNTIDTFGSNHKFSLVQVNLKKLAKVSLTANIDNAGSDVDFSYKIGIEKRAIQLTPEETKKRIEELNKTITKWEDISSNLGSVVTGFKAACLGVESYLVVKSFFAGGTGISGARQQIMPAWEAECKGISGEGKQYKTTDACLLANNDKIENDVNQVATAKKTAASVGDVTTQNIGQIYSGLGATVTDPLSKVNPISTDDLKAVFSDQGLKDGSISQTEAKSLRELNAIINDNSISDEVRNKAMSQRYSLVYQINQNAQARQTILNAEKSESTLGITGVSIRQDAIQGGIKGTYTGGTTTASNKLGLPAGEPIQGVVYNGAVYYLDLAKNSGSDTYRIAKVYDDSAAAVSDKGTLDSINKLYSGGFQKIDSASYNNKYKNPEVRYYETGAAKGYPEVVPVDVDRGWYAATRPLTTFGDNSKAYDASGFPIYFYLGNVMGNGVEEFDVSSGDDRYMGFNPGTGTIYGTFPGLTETQTATYVKQALNAISEAQKQYKPGLSGYITINGNRIKVGSPAVNIPGTNCQDVMSPADCSLLFNSCDPVMCPSSRCNLGGNYYVSDVVQSGIIGSIALCLPNFKGFGGDVYIPVCLTGIKAGIDGLLSVFKSYRDCLQENLNTGQYVGICDEVYSIYLCEFFWREALPFTKFIFTNVLGWVFGQSNGKGGGEYFSFASAWSGAENSVNYFTQQYAINSFNAFNLRSTDEAGTAVCKNFISARYPASGNFLSSLLEPESPPQYTAWFDEIPFTTATLPATSQYKVFYHIYAGQDIGVYYQVYMKTSSQGTSLFNTNPTLMVATGYIAKGGYYSETKDLTAPSGYQQLCISINAQEECGFKQVSTSFAVNYIKDQYLAGQASNTNINTESECVSGSPSALGIATTTNLEEGVNTAVNPNIQQNGIVRVCSTTNPGQGTDVNAGTNQARWLAVGTCDNGAGKLKCWLDSNSVKSAIDITSLQNQALSSAQQSATNELNNRENQLITIPDSDRTEITNAINLKDEKANGYETTLLNIIPRITTLFNEAVMSNEKAQLLFWRAQIYGKLAKFYYNKQVSSSSSPTTTSTNTPTTLQVTPTFDTSLMGTTADNQLIEASPDLITFLSCMDKEYTTTYYPGKHLQVNSITDPNLYGSSPSCDLREYSESGCKYAQSSCHYNVEGGKIQSRAAEISLSGYQSNFVDTCFNKCNTDGNANSVLDQQDTTYNVFVGCSESNS